MTRRSVLVRVLAALAAGPAIVAATAGSAVAAAVEKVNINTASVKDLQKLDGRGVIVTARSHAPFDFVSRFFAPAVGLLEDPVTGSAHCFLGPFKRGEDLRKVEGVGAATFERNRERIVVK